ITKNVLSRMFADSTLAARPRSFVSPRTPAPTPANQNLFKNGQPAAGGDQLASVSSGMRVTVVSDATSASGSAYRLEFASALSQARSLPIMVDPATTYCVAADMRVEAALQVRYRVS